MGFANRPARSAYKTSDTWQEGERQLYLEAGRLLHSGHEGEAAVRLAALAERELPPDLQKSVQADLAALRGSGSFGRRFELGWERFFRETARPSTLAGMAAGQLAFAPLRAAFLRPLANNLSSRFLASALAGAGESTLFLGVSKSVDRLFNPAATFPNSNLASEWFSLWMTLGVLRLTGVGTKALLKTGVRAFNPAFVQGAASVTGLYGSSWLLEKAGFKPEQSASHRWTDALVGTLQFAVTGRMAAGLLGPGFARWNASWEGPTAPRRRAAAFFPENFLPLETRLSTGSGGRLPVFTSQSSGPRPPHFAMSQAYSTGGGGANSLVETQKIIAQVLDMGTKEQIGRLREIVLTAYQSLGLTPIENVQRYYKSNDWEDWKSFVRILAVGKDGTPLRVAEALTGLSEFATYQAAWKEQPHFRSIDEVYLQTHGRVSTTMVAQRYVEKLRFAFKDGPTHLTLKTYASDALKPPKRGQPKRDLPFEWKHATSPSGRVLSLGKVDQWGLVIEFNEKGFLTLPIVVQKLPDLEWTMSTLEAFAQGKEWKLPRLPDPPKPPAPAVPITVQYFPGTVSGQFFSQAVRMVKGKLSHQPDESAITLIRQHARTPDPGPEPEAIPMPDGGRGYVFHTRFGKKLHAVVLQFEAGGKLRLPIRMGNELNAERLAAVQAALRDGSFFASSEGVSTVSKPVPPPPAPKANPVAVPVQADKPVEYALSFLQQSQSVDPGRHLQLAKTLEGLFKNSSNPEFGRETVARLEGMTRSLKAGSQAVVRKFVAPGLDGPLFIYGNPLLELPQAWALNFARHLREEIQKEGPARLTVELASETGWLALYLQKAGLTQSALGVDGREIAQVAGRVNAWINHPAGIKSKALLFGEVEAGYNLPLEKRADVVVALVPGEGGALRKDGWALLVKTLHRASTYLEPGSRVYLGVQNPRDQFILADVLRKHGFQAAISMMTVERQGYEGTFYSVSGRSPR